ncbi:MAG: response regulator transcription factor [Oscillospiraceae bacterium]|nr:response regulator transcription factor [Oscillospiraceae bacterium]
MYNIVVCDDDRDIVSALTVYLTGEGYRVLPAYTGQEALDWMEREEVHLILMDIMMPGLDGLGATERLRERSNVPVILLTAKSEDCDKVQGLILGADDYVTKPFSPTEGLARVKSQLRRYTVLGGRQEETLLINGGIEMNDRDKRVTVDGQERSLTPLEYSILHLLMLHPGQVFSTRQLYEQVWKDTFYGSENTVAVHIRHLREKIEIDPGNPRYLKVVWGVGYKMERVKR